MDAARIVFAKRGLRASHDDIAREAQVGVGTVYRRFPEKEQLIDALFEEAMERIGAIAEEALAMEDPWEGLVHFVVGAQELQCADRALKELVISAERGAERVAQARDRIAPLVQQLLTRGQDAGVVRDDITFTDLTLLQIGVGAITDATRDVAPETWRRSFAIVLDGLRASRATARPLTEPPLTMAQYHEAMLASVPVRR